MLRINYATTPANAMASANRKKREGLLSMNSCLAKITVVKSMFTKLELLKKILTQCVYEKLISTRT